MKTEIICFLLLIFTTLGCNRDSKTEKHYSEYDKVINIHEKIHPIEIKDVFLSGSISPCLAGNCLVIGDYQNPDKQVHLFDKNSFKYILSTATKGRGPKEITVLGLISADEVHRKIYVSDNAKLQIFSYDLDSLLADPQYVPSIKVNMNTSRFPVDFKYISDTLCFGRIIEPIGNNDFKPYVGKWNMLTNEIQLMKYEHPDIKRKRIASDVSPELGLYVEAHHVHDLITVGTLDGELKYNIYGPNWEIKLSKKKYYSFVKFCRDKIITTYLNDDGLIKEPGGSLRGQSPSKFVIFDSEGNYLQTWETNYEITRFIYDEENNRIIMTLWDADIQFAYLNLDGLL